MDCHKKCYWIISRNQIWCKACLIIKGEANAHGVLNRAPLFYTAMVGHHKKVPTTFMTSWIKGFTTYIRRHDTGRSFGNVKPIRPCKWQLQGPLEWGEAGAHLFFNRAFFFQPVIQDFIFKRSCVAHGALLNFGNGCGIFHNLDHSCKRTHAVWEGLGSRAWPRGKMAMSLLSGGQRTTFQIQAVGFLQSKRNQRRRIWKLCGTCLILLSGKRKGLVLKGPK